MRSLVLNREQRAFVLCLEFVTVHRLPFVWWILVGKMLMKYQNFKALYVFPNRPVLLSNPLQDKHPCFIPTVTHASELMTKLVWLVWFIMKCILGDVLIFIASFVWQMQDRARLLRSGKVGTNVASALAVDRLLLWYCSFYFLTDVFSARPPRLLVSNFEILSCRKPTTSVPMLPELGS